MSGKIFLWLLATVLLITLASARAQQPKKIYRMGYLSASDPARDLARAEAIRLALRELGYIEGQDIATEYRYAEGKRDRYPELAAELVRLRVDIAVLYDPANPAHQYEVKEDLPAAARALGLTVRSWEVRAADGSRRYSLR